MLRNNRSNGQVSFNLRDWQTSTGGGIWQQWWVENSILQTSLSGSPDCLSAADQPGNDPAVIRISPNPARVLLQMELNEQVLPAQVEVLDLQGKCFYTQKVSTSNTSIQVNDWPAGMYFFRVKSSGMSYSRDPLRNLNDQLIQTFAATVSSGSLPTDAAR